MVIFHKYDIRIKPGTSPALTLYVPTQEDLEKSEEYMRLVAEKRPCRFQLTDTQIWYRNGENNRQATEEEISGWTQNNEYIRMPQMEIHSPMISYPAYGDETILAPLKEKMQKEYTKYLADWEKVYNENRDMFFSQLGDICVVKTVYNNLFNWCDHYPTVYMKNLLKEDRPLQILACFYNKMGRFSIEPEAADFLETMERNLSDISKYYAIEERAVYTDDHEQLMAILDENLDFENLENEQKWQTLNFDETLDKAIEIYTLRQLYHTLRHEKHLYPADQLDIAAQFTKPIEHEQGDIVGPRDMYSYSLNEIRNILPQIYPDTVCEPDPWNFPLDNREKQTNELPFSFSVAKGKEQEYLQIRAQNNMDFYGAGIIRYLETWASMMEKEIADGVPVAQAAQSTQYKADKQGITGYMYGCAVNILSGFWEYGEELQQWHNQQYEYTGGEVVNPAVLTLDEADEEQNITLNGLAGM